MGNKSSKVHPSPEMTVPNPLGYPSACTLITSKKLAYYVHRYDPTKMIELLTQRLGADLVSTRFDGTIRDNCCNIISISLYFIGCIPDNMAKYLMSIERTVKNVQNNLPDWIVRIYLDESVHNCMKTIEITSLEKKAYDYIISAPNVEIYTYNCPSILDENIARKRTYRFLPFSDEDVNICIVREADGIVSNWDCIQIKLFSKDDKKMFYFHDNQIDRSTMTMFSSYAWWLLIYKVIFRYDFFSTHYMDYDLLAGLFGIKLKLKREYYIDTIVSVRTEIDVFTTKVKANDDTAYNGRGDTFYLSPERLPATIKYNMVTNENALSTGFDEILLLEMFKEVFSFHVKNTHLVTHTDFTNVIHLKTIQQISAEYSEIYDILKKQIQDFVLDERTFVEPIVIDMVRNINMDVDAICRVLIDAKIIRACKPPVSVETVDLLYFIDGQLLDKDNLLPVEFTFSITLKYYSNNGSVHRRDILSHLLNMPYRNMYDKYYNPLSQHRGGYNITKINRRHKRYIREYKSKHKRCIRDYKSKHKKQRTKNNKTHRRFRGI